MSVSDTMPAASAATPQVLPTHHLKALKLPTFLSEYAKLAQECAQEGVDHARYLPWLAKLELVSRERRVVERRIRAALFPAVKSFDTFDFTAIPALNRTLTLELAGCEYVVRRANIAALGPSGVGKSDVALALGVATCQRGFSVPFITASALVNQQLIEARDERRPLRLLAQLAAANALPPAQPINIRAGNGLASVYL